jgi:hypothetical protein
MTGVVVLNRAGVNVLPRLGSNYSLTATSTQTRQALTAGTTQLSIANGGPEKVRFLTGGGSVTAVATTSRVVQPYERVEFAIDPASDTYISVILDSSSGAASAAVDVQELI